MRPNLSIIEAAFVLVAACLPAVASDAKPARCFTTDDGAFLCQFRMTDARGSFEISAPGKPTYALNISEPGVAFGYMTLGDESIPLPGRYLRSRSDRACWRNDTTDTEICAR